VGAFSLKFLIAPIGETKDRIKKSYRGAKAGRTSSSIYHHAKYGGGRGSRAGCRRKSDVMFFFCLFYFVTVWNYGVCYNGNAMKQCNFQNNYGVIA